MNLEDVKNAAREHVQSITAIHPTRALPKALLSKELRSTELASLVETLDIPASAKHTSQVFEIIIVLDIYLAADRESEKEYLDHEAAILVRQWLAEAILPTEAFAESSPYSMEEKATRTPDDLAKFCAMSLSGLVLLARLQKVKPPSEDEHVVSILTCLASFTDLNDPWTCSKARDQAHSLLENHTASGKLSTAFTRLLRERIKPLFAKTSNPAITKQGRRAIDPLPSSATAHSDLDDDAKPWKYRNAYSVTVFQWVLEHLDEMSVQANWPLIIPPLLALIDDSSTKYKVKGCNLLAMFLQRCPSLLLESTGLGEIFENAAMPCLLSLPSLTEEAESLEMLKAAYPALISLALVRFPGGKHQAAKVKALDKILRNGVLKGYAQAGEYVSIGTLLVNEMTVLVKELGIESVKHLKVSCELLWTERWLTYLKHILPLLTSVFAAPFAAAYPALLQASVEAVRTILITDWPRIAHHRGEILKGVTICWCRIEDEEAQSQELDVVQESIEQVVQLLTCTMARNSRLVEECQILIDSDRRLRELLDV